MTRKEREKKNWISFVGLILNIGRGNGLPLKMIKVSYFITSITVKYVVSY